MNARESLTQFRDVWSDNEERPKPYDRVLAHYLERFSYEEIVDAMEIAIKKKGPERGVPYTIGILRNWRDHGRET